MKNIVIEDKELPNKKDIRSGNYWINYDLPTCRDNWDLIFGENEATAETNLLQKHPSAMIIESVFYG